MNNAKFVRYLFERPFGATEWYLCDEHEDPNVGKDFLVRLTTDIFKKIAEISSQFDESQICMGLHYLINPSCGPIPYLYLDTDIYYPIRASAISSMEIVFRDLFARRLSGKGPFRYTDDSRLSYRETCYMWWDMFPRHGVPAKSDLEKTDDIICQAMGSILTIDNLPCQESALHGLGHWFSSRPDEVADAIRTFPPR